MEDAKGIGRALGLGKKRNKDVKPSKETVFVKRDLLPFLMNLEIMRMLDYQDLSMSILRI